MENIVPDLVALVALTAMEIVLGIDNIVFISVVSNRLPLEQQKRARQIGLLLAMGMRIVLLFGISYVVKATEPLFSIDQLPLPTALTAWLTGHVEINEVSWRDLILLVGGLFLIRSSVIEIHNKTEGEDHDHESAKKATFGRVIAQIVMLDAIFSLDSVLTAVGMAESLWVMVTAVVLAVGVMLVFAGTVSAFVEKHPTVKMLALSFLLLIGVMLVAEGIGSHIEKGYIYFAMGFALLVEVLNLRVKARAKAKRELAADH
ncbi:MAG: TerC family protein [Pirellulaceae bacterium]